MDDTDADTMRQYHDMVGPGGLMKKIIPGYRGELWCAAVLLLVSFAFFLINITHEQLWCDEAFSLFFSTGNVATILRNVGFDGTEFHPPLYHLVLAAIRVFFGNSIVILRGFSALCGGALVAVVYLFSRELFGHRTAVATSMLLIINPIVVAFSQELRMYMPATLLVSVNIFSLYRAVRGERENRSGRYWIAYTVTAIMGVYTHYYFFMTFFVVLVYMASEVLGTDMATRMRRRIISRYLLSQVTVIAAFIPWVGAIVKQRHETTLAPWFESADAAAPLKIIGYFYTTKFSYNVNVVPYYAMAVGICLIVVYGIWTVIRSKKNYGKLVLPVAGFFVPVIVSWLFSIRNPSVLNFRYFVLYFPFLAILTANGVVAVPVKKVSAGILVVILAVSAVPVVNVFKQNFNGSGRDAADFLKQNSMWSEPIISVDNAIYATLLLYLNRRKNLFYYSPVDLPACFGVNIRRTTFIVGEKIRDVIEPQKSFFLVMSPGTKMLLEEFKVKFPEFEIDTAVPQKIFQFKYSWLRIRIVRFIRR